MCMQCSAEAVVTKSEVLPGYSLMRSTRGIPEWPKDWYGIVRCNDPVFVFEGPLLKDPCIGLTEDALDAMPEYPDGYDEYEAWATKLSNTRINHVLDAHGFIQACIEAGYSVEVHGTQFGFWLGHHLALQAEN